MTRDVTPTVLLVDTQDDRGMYATYLRASDFRTIEIGNTADALALAITADVIVTGIRVPGAFDGIELVHRLRADTQTRNKPIIVLTACAGDPDQRRAHSAGCDGFLVKPCLPETLVAEIRRELSVRSFPRRSGTRRGTRRQAQRIA